MLQTLIYWTGAFVWLGLIGFVGALIARYMLIAVLFWWARVWSEHRHPGEEIKPEYKIQWFWRFRLLLRILFSTTVLEHWSSCSVQGSHWEVDIFGWVPKLRFS